MNPIFLYAGGAALVGVIGGFIAGKGTSGIGQTVKYAVIGAGLVVAGKALKVI